MKTRFRFFFLLAMITALFFTFSAKAQSGTLKGKVIDEKTKEPIPFAHVLIELNGKLICETAANFDGKYTIKPIPPGIYDIMTCCIGYNKLYIKDIEIKADSVTYVESKCSEYQESFFPISEVYPKFKPKGFYTNIIEFKQSTGSLKGKIIDNKTKKPVPFALVSIYMENNPIIGTYTIANINGDYITNPIRPGIYNVCVTSNGYFYYLTMKKEIKSGVINELVIAIENNPKPNETYSIINYPVFYSNYPSPSGQTFNSLEIQRMPW
jgi:hypothetical protein